jgi:hypothetical protein
VLRLYQQEIGTIYILRSHLWVLEVIAVDGVGGKIYWIDSSASSKMKRANLDGTSPEDLSAVSDPRSLALA